MVRWKEFTRKLVEYNPFFDKVLQRLYSTEAWSSHLCIHNNGDEPVEICSIIDFGIKRRSKINEVNRMTVHPTHHIEIISRKNDLVFPIRGEVNSNFEFSFLDTYSLIFPKDLTFPPLVFISKESFFLSFSC